MRLASHRNCAVRRNAKEVQWEIDPVPAALAVDNDHALIHPVFIALSDFHLRLIAGEIFFRYCLIFSTNRLNRTCHVDLS